MPGRRPARNDLGLAHNERLPVTGAVEVGPAGATVARRGARHRIGRSPAALVEGGGAGDFLGGAPGAVRLADDKRLLAGAVGVEPAGAAVARGGARHRVERGEPALVEGGGAGGLPGGAPGAVLLIDDEHLLVAGAVCVVPGRAAVAGRGARHRDDPGDPALVEGRGPRNLRRAAPGTGHGGGCRRGRVRSGCRKAGRGRPHRAECDRSDHHDGASSHRFPPTASRAAAPPSPSTVAVTQRVSPYPPEGCQPATSGLKIYATGPRSWPGPPRRWRRTAAARPRNGGPRPRRRPPGAPRTSR